MTHPLQPELPEVVKRIHAAMERDTAVNLIPADHTVPAVLLRWDFVHGILRIGHALQSELEPHICYLRIADVQLTFAQMMEATAKQAVRDPRLNKLGQLMAGQLGRRLVHLD